METLSAALFLVLPSATLWVTHVREEYKPQEVGLGKVIVLLAMIVYTITVVTIGADTIQGVKYELLGFNLKRFSVFFVFPGLAFGLILFPKIAGMFFDNYFQLASIQATELYAYYGWGILFISLLSALFWL